MKDRFLKTLVVLAEVFVQRRVFVAYLAVSMLVCLWDVYYLLRYTPCSYKPAAWMKAGFSGCVAWSALCSMVAYLKYGEEGAQETYVPAIMMGVGISVWCLGWVCWLCYGRLKGKKRGGGGGGGGGEEQGEEGKMAGWEKLIKDKREEKKRKEAKRKLKEAGNMVLTSVRVQKGGEKGRFEAARAHIQKEEEEEEGVEMSEVGTGVGGEGRGRGGGGGGGGGGGMEE